MARQDFERDDDRYEDRTERRFGRSGNGGERDDWSSGSRRQGSGRESRTGARDYGREQQEWRRGSERTRDAGYGYGSGEHGTQQWGEGRSEDREYRERTEGYGGRGWESSGLGGPSTYGGYSGYGEHSGYGQQGSMGSPYGSGYGGSQYGGSQYGMGQSGMTQRYGGQSAGPWGQTGSPYGPRGMGQHYGCGPKGYRRSDERIREDVNEALFRDEHVDATEIEVEVKDAEVTLSGTVDGREAKRMAEDCVWNVAGVRNVTNTIRVEPDKHGERSTMGSGGMEEKSRRTSGQTGKSGSNT